MLERLHLAKVEYVGDRVHVGKLVVLLPPDVYRLSLLRGDEQLILLLQEDPEVLPPAGSAQWVEFECLGDLAIVEAKPRWVTLFVTIAATGQLLTYRWRLGWQAFLLDRRSRVGWVA